MRRNLRQGDAATLNLFYIDGSSDTNTTLWKGLAPSFGDPALDGCILGVRTLHDWSSTASHEVGHWFGLLHTFSTRCAGNTDFVDDTPDEIRNTTSDLDPLCLEGRDSCPEPENPGLDPVHNFMTWSTELVILLILTSL